MKVKFGSVTNLVDLEIDGVKIAQHQLNKKYKLINGLTHSWKTQLRNRDLQGQTRT